MAKNIRLITSYLEPAKANSFTLQADREDGSLCTVHLLASEEHPLEKLQELLSNLFAKLEEEVVKPWVPPPRDPILDDPNVITKSYDAIYKEAIASKITPQEFLNAMREDGWEHMPNHAAMMRRIPQLSTET